MTKSSYVILTNGYSIRLYKSYVAHSDLKDRLLCNLDLCDIAEEFYEPKGLWEIVCKDSLLTAKPLLENIRELRDRLNKEAIFLDGIIEDFARKPNKTELLNNALKIQKSYKYDKAILEYRKCLVLDDITAAERIVILNFIANCFFCLGRINEAIGHYSEAYRIAKKSNQIEAIREFFENMSRIQFFKGELNNALISIKESQTINVQIKNLVSKSKFNELYGRIIYVKGKIDEALKYIEEALKVNREIGHRQREASNLDAIGRLMHAQGKNDEALSYLEEALKINREIGHRQGKASNLEAIGRLMRDQGKMDEAMKYFKKALDINRHIGYRQAEAMNLYSMGTYYENKQNWREALKFFKESKNIAYEIGIVYQFSTLSKKIRKISKSLFDKKERS